jgi:ribose 5-phosphate isomerase B
MVWLVATEQTKAVYIASDHGGFDLKKFLVGELAPRGYCVTDLGPSTYNPNDDYPAYAKMVAEAVAKAEDAGIGIVLCRNGVGMSVVANKVRGIRCALSWTPEHARSAKTDDNANVLALPADYITREVALQTALTFLSTPFSNADRHVARLADYGDTGNF